MTIRDLINQLEDAAEIIGDDAEVRLAQQPRWPFEYSIPSDGVVTFDGIERDDDDPDGEDSEELPACCYIGEGRQIGYLPGTVRNALGWSRG